MSDFLANGFNLYVLVMSYSIVAAAIAVTMAFFALRDGSKLFKPSSFPLLFASVIIILIAANVCLSSYVFIEHANTDYNFTENFFYGESWFKRYIIQGFEAFAVPIAAIAVIWYLFRQIKKQQEANEAQLLQLLEAERLRADLVTNITHDIRTPLTSLVTYGNLLQSGGMSDPRAPEWLDAIDRKSKQLDNLLTGLLDASRAGAGTVPIRREVLDLGELVGQAVGEMDDAFTAAGLTCTCELPAGTLPVLADGDQLQRVLGNLLSNARKYALADSTVEVRVTEQNGYALIGISNKMQPGASPVSTEWLEQFTRGDVARGSAGHGLGLFIAKRLCDLMGAGLAIAGRDGSFAATVSLPVQHARPQGVELGV
jgi:signal transduction histidine kinase